jgi:hypothetical protein
MADWRKAERKIAERKSFERTGHERKREVERKMTLFEVNIRFLNVSFREFNVTVEAISAVSNISKSRFPWGFDNRGMNVLKGFLVLQGLKGTLS